MEENNSNQQEQKNFYYYDEKQAAKNDPTAGLRQARSSMRLGLLSLVFFCVFFNLITAAVSIVKGVRYLLSRAEEGRRMAILGIATSVLSVVMFFGGWTAVLGNTAFQNAVMDYMTESGGYSMEDLDLPEDSLNNEGEEL